MVFLLGTGELAREVHCKSVAYGFTVVNLTHTVLHIDIVSHLSSCVSFIITFLSMAPRSFVGCCCFPHLLGIVIGTRVCVCVCVCVCVHARHLTSTTH